MKLTPEAVLSESSPMLVGLDPVAACARLSSVGSALVDCSSAVGAIWNT